MKKTYHILSTLNQLLWQYLLLKHRFSIYLIIMFVKIINWLSLLFIHFES